MIEFMKDEKVLLLFDGLDELPNKSEIIRNILE